ncbi:TREM1 protein, partial [Trogon melanurus]|nr:TREM1 protein [Trogon melanurus]
LIFTGLQAQTPDAVESRWEGSAMHVQCPYTAQVQNQDKKAWCQVRDGQCIPLVETRYSGNNQDTTGKVTIEDNHMLRTIFVTMTNLQVEDSGTYFCAYRSYSYRFGYSHRYYLLKGISLNVFKELLKWELDSLSVQCKYSTSAHSTDTKVWLRRGLIASKILLRTDYPPKWTGSKALKDRALIQDDTWKNTVTITMKKLQVQDTGTYWCELHSGLRVTPIMEVRLSVTKTSAGTTLPGIAGTSQATPSGNTPAPSSNANTFILLSGILSILFVLALISSVMLCVRWRKQLKTRGNRQAEDTYDEAGDVAQLSSTERMESPKDDNEDLNYVTLNFKSQLSPKDPLYCNIEPSQAHRKPKDENVEYSIVALK